MCTLTSTLATYRLGQDTRVRRVLQAKVADNLALRGISTTDIWDVKPPTKLTPAEVQRLERQRLNKRNWARKERERSKKKLEELKTTNCQLEYTNRRLKSDVDKLRRGHFQLKSALKDHDCRRLPQKISTQLLLSSLLPVVTSSHQAQELAVDLGQRVFVLCSAPSGESDATSDAASASSPGALRRRLRSESSAGPALAVDRVRQYRKGVSWPAEHVTYVLVEDDPSSGTSVPAHHLAVVTAPQLAAEEVTAADDESVTSGGFAVQTGEADVAECADVSGGGFLRMLTEDEGQVVLSVEVSTGQTAAGEFSVNDQVLFMQELDEVVPKIDGMNAPYRDDPNAGTVILEEAPSQQVSLAGENCEEVVQTPCGQLEESPEKGSNSGSLQRRGLVMDPWCVSAGASNSSTLGLVQNHIAKGLELISHQTPPSNAGTRVISPGCHSPTEADDQLAKLPSTRVRFSHDGDAAEASPAKRPRFFSLPAGVAAITTCVSSQTTDTTEHLYYETGKDGSQSADSNLHRGVGDVQSDRDASFCPGENLVPPEDMPDTPSTPSSTGSLVPGFASSDCLGLANDGSEGTR